MKSVYAFSEVTGLATTGGLDDMTAVLSRARADRGHERRVIMPQYHRIRSRVLWRQRCWDGAPGAVLLS